MTGIKALGSHCRNHSHSPHLCDLMVSRLVRSIAPSIEGKAPRPQGSDNISFNYIEAATNTAEQ